MTTPLPPIEPADVGLNEPHPVPELGPSRRKRRRRRRGLSLRRAVALTVLGLLLGAIGMGAGTLLRLALPAAPLNLGGAAPGESLNVLVIGVDPTPVPQQDDDKTVRRLADSIQVLSLDYHNHRAFVLAIPRDTKATLGQNGDGALGDALALGGIPLVKDTVEELTGLTIHHYVWIDLDGAKELVTALGGLEEYFPKPVKFADKANGLSLDLGEGWHNLTPAQTLAYAFYRAPGGDLERLARDQMMAAQWQRQFNGTWAGFWFPGLATRAMSAIVTDLPKADFETLAGEWRKVEARDMSYALLPGEVSAKGEWLMSPQRWDTVLPRLQAVPSTRTVMELKPTVEILYEADPPGKPSSGADEKVLGLADKLTKQGFHVLRTAKQAVPQDENLIIDRTRADERSGPVLQALDAAVKGGRVFVDPGNINGYGAQYSLELGKGFFR